MEQACIPCSVVPWGAGGKPAAGLGDSTSLSDDDAPRSFGPHDTLPFLHSWLPLLTQIPAKEAFITTQEFPVEDWNRGEQVGRGPTTTARLGKPVLLGKWAGSSVL